MPYVSVHIGLDQFQDKEMVAHLEGAGYTVIPPNGVQAPTERDLQHALLAGDQARVTEIAREIVRSNGLLA